MTLREVRTVFITYSMKAMPFPGLAKDTKKTIEFRQYEGSIDPDAVTNWVRFCVGLVKFADSTDPEN
jgi:hypothetical protein